MGWYYVSIPKLQRCNRWSLGMDEQFHPSLCNVCNYLSMLGLKLIRVSKRSHRCHLPHGIRETGTKSIWTSVEDDHAKRRPRLWIYRWVQMQPLYYTGDHAQVRMCVSKVQVDCCIEETDEIAFSLTWYMDLLSLQRHNEFSDGGWYAQQTTSHHYLALASSP